MTARKFNLTGHVHDAGARLYVAAQRITAAVRRLRDDASGATAIEYGLLAAGISVAIVGTVFLLGPELNNAFETVLNAVSGAGA